MPLSFRISDSESSKGGLKIDLPKLSEKPRAQPAWVFKIAY